MAEIHDGATLRAALLEIACDFSFTWIAETRLLFDALAPRRFAELHHNPTALLSELTDDDLARALTPDYLERLARVQGRLARDRGQETWWRSRSGPSDLLVAYFSAEFGLDESLPIYSGGLGVLAGDYLKAASELGLPLVGIGLFYRRGYFRQQLDEHDRQIEHYPLTDTSRLPLELVPMAPLVELADDDGNLVPVRLGVWRVRVGRVSLYLIDTWVEGNPDWAVTDRLYGGDRANRLRQEVLPREAAALDEPPQGSPDEVGIEHLVPGRHRRVRREDGRRAQPLDRLVRRQALLLDELAHPLQLQKRGVALVQVEDRRLEP